ncbi:MAG TPA: GspE/PulE family protein, partial [Gemmatimonadales bacterium]|nr:GspE/PulE family protein [Gemmatimonadales bacterium]
AAAQRGALEGRPMAQVLHEHYHVEEPVVYRALGEKYSMPFLDGDALFEKLDPEVAHRIPLRFRAFHRLIPLRVEGQRALVATCDPFARLPELAPALGVQSLDFCLITPTSYERLNAMVELARSGRPEPAVAPLVEERRAAALDSVTVALFDAILFDAVARRASDVHLEIYEDRPRVRVRVDGELRDVDQFHLSAFQFVALVNVGKVRARLDIAERRAPQGGRFSIEARGQAFDVRAQTQPAMYGEHLVLRLLPQNTKPLGIEALGFSDEVATRYRRLLRNPGGLLLVVGPTGSGKSTTLYAGLQLLAADPTRKAISVEDPIEYAITGVQQCQVLPEVGFTFANAMRAFVREDPDVILVGEIRDTETALEALRASQTGHLVLSTLHCYDSVDAVQRLVDLGMHPNSIGSELLAVIAQRLAKRICPSCRTEVAPDPEMAADVFPAGVPAGFRCWKGAGCERCDGHGTYGRIAVGEYLTVSPRFRAGIAHHLTVDELRELARADGLRPLREEALALVQRGLIEFSELRDLLTTEHLAEPALRPPVLAG